MDTARVTAGIILGNVNCHGSPLSSLFPHSIGKGGRYYSIHGASNAGL